MNAPLRGRRRANKILNTSKTAARKTINTTMTTGMLTADIVVTADCWRAEPGAEDIVQRAIGVAAGEAAAPIHAAELAIMLTDDAGIRALNHDWRGIDKPTNVLSFPAIKLPGGGSQPGALGDIAIAYETARREAEAENKPFNHHLSHLAVHGFLHLIGYDHETDEDAEAMEQLERHILARLGIPDPYA
jgi:probable rRNA maturation factor